MAKKLSSTMKVILVIVAFLVIVSFTGDKDKKASGFGCSQGTLGEDDLNPPDLMEGQNCLDQQDKCVSNLVCESPCIYDNNMHDWVCATTLVCINPHSAEYCAYQLDSIECNPGESCMPNPASWICLCTGGTIGTINTELGQSGTCNGISEWTWLHNQGITKYG